MLHRFALVLGFAFSLAGAARAHDTTIGAIVVVHAHAKEPADAATRDIDVFMTLRNTSSEPDRLVALASPFAASAELRTGRGDTVASLELPAGRDVRLAAGGVRIRLTGIAESLAGYATVPLFLTFARAGRAEVEVLVEERDEGDEHMHPTAPVSEVERPTKEIKP